MNAPRLPQNLHATVVVVAGHGILIRGASRSGKSALALSVLRRAEALGLDAALVCDDQVLVEASGGRLTAQAIASIAGRIEISGVGILNERFVATARLHLVVDLCERDEIARLPETFATVISGVRLRRIVLPAREAAFGADVLSSLAKASAIGETPR